jgi:hypothetical protein
MRSNGALGSPTPFDLRTLSGDAVPAIYYGSGVSIVYYVAGDQISSAGSVIVANTWQHVAVCKASGTTRMFVDGTQVGGSYADSNNYGASNPLTFGAAFNGTSGLNGWVASLRIRKGTALYTGNFTPPTAPFPDIASR